MSLRSIGPLEIALERERGELPIMIKLVKTMEIFPTTLVEPPNFRMNSSLFENGCGQVESIIRTYRRAKFLF